MIKPHKGHFNLKVFLSFNQLNKIKNRHNSNDAIFIDMDCGIQNSQKGMATDQWFSSTRKKYQAMIKPLQRNTNKS